MSINVHKLYRNIKVGMFEFFNKNIIKQNNPVVVVKLETNVTDIMFDIILKKCGKELHDAIKNENSIVPLEGAARIYVINSDASKTSALFSEKCLGKYIPKEVIKEIDEKVQENIIDYVPYESTGIILGTKKNKIKVLDIGFMKSKNTITLSRNMVAKTFDNIIENVLPSIEYGYLKHIYDCQLNKLNPKAAAKFSRQMAAIENIRDINMNYDQMFYYMWNNPFLETLTITGIMAGMMKVAGTTGNLPHNAVAGFIHLYNQNKF